MLELPLLLDARYRLDREVGRGGFGTVYEARHLTLGTPVAVKVMHVDEHIDAAKRTELAARFLEEGRMLTRLRHPNIVSALDLGISPIVDGEAPSPYLVMEWVEGSTLSALLSSSPGALPLEEVWPFFESVLDALAHAHAAGVVHRDLKPGNIMVVPESTTSLEASGHHAASALGVPRIIDFGVAKLVAPDEDIGSGATETAHPSSAFTPAYAAPEQVAHARTGPWTDVHALGLLFVELVTGTAPYGETENARLAAIDPTRPTPKARGVDVGALEDVVARAVALRPRDRFAHAGEFLEAAREAARTIPRLEGPVGLPKAVAASSSPPRVAAVRNPPVAVQTGPNTIGRQAGLKSGPTRAPIADVTAPESDRQLPAASPLGRREPIDKTSARRTRMLAIGLAFVAATGAAIALGVRRSTPIEAAAPGSAAPEHPSTLHAGELAFRVQAGRWREEAGALVGSGGQVVSETTFAEGTLEVDVDVVASGRSLHSVGVGFHAIPAADPSDGSGYGFNFRVANGTFRLVKGSEGDWHSIEPQFPNYHPSPAVHAGKNHVSVRAKGSSYVAELNGVPVGGFEDPSYPKGAVTLWVESTDQTVRFSNIRFTPL